MTDFPKDFKEIYEQLDLLLNFTNPKNMYEPRL